MEDKLAHTRIHVPEVELVLTAVPDITPDLRYRHVVEEERALRGEMSLYCSCR
jgi:hypothetical protein